MSSDIVVEPVGDDARLCAAWSSYIDHCPSATVYHDLAWREIFAKSFGYTSVHLMARIRGNSRIVGALPLFEVPSLFGKPRLVAVPFRDRGGPLFDDIESLDALLRVANQEGAKIGAAGLVLKVLSPLPDESMGRARLVETQRWVRSVSDLRGLSDETLMRRLGGKARNKIRQAQRAQLRFEDFTGREDAAQIYYLLHLKTQRRLGLPPFPRLFFETMIARLAPGGHLRFFAVTDKDGVPMAAMIVLLERHRAIYAYGDSDSSRLSARPNDLLLYSALRWAISNGYKEFDMGSDSPEQESLLFFKRKYLADQVAIPVYSSQGLDADTNNSSAPRYRLARKILRYLPQALVAPLLSRTVRYFG